MKATTLLPLVLGLLLCGCPNPDADSSGTATPGTGAVEPRLSSTVDHLAETLAGESLDQRHLALLVVNNFGLTEYRDEVLALAPTDPVAATVCAAVFGDIQPALDYFAAQPHGVRVDSLLGSMYGLACAAEIPAELWVALLGEVDEDELNAMLWAMAQLDIEPGGPLIRGSELNAVWLKLFDETLQADRTYRLGALDALLGHADGRAIGWQRYVEYVKESPWNFNQWAALLRWSDAATWNSIVLTQGLEDRIRYQIGRAVALAAPPEVRLPGGIGPWAGIEADIEYRANQLVTGKTTTMPLPELAVLVEDARRQLADTAATDPVTVNQRVLGDVLAVLDYALIHNDPEVITAVVDAMPELPAEARSGVMATFMRRRPAALSDDQLARLVALSDPNVAYFLLSGWHDRQVIRDGPTAGLVKLAIGYDNVLLYQGYELWLSHHPDLAADPTSAPESQTPSM